MKFELIDDWKAVLAKAWSLRFSMLAAALGVLELVFPLVTAGVLPDGTVPRGAFITFSVVLNVFVIPAVRVMSQKEIVSVVLPKE